jgi:5-methylcytosine-specific restriction endonuclease McrA
MTTAEIEQMRELRDAGYSYGLIGSVYGVSRQRIHQLISGYGLIRANSRYRLLRSIVLKRDGNKCQECNSTTNLIVHHIDGDNKNNDLTNLITLCNPCHLYLHRHRIKQQRLRDTVALAIENPKWQAKQQAGQMSMTDLVERHSRLTIIQGVNRQLRAVFMTHQKVEQNNIENDTEKPSPKKCFENPSENKGSKPVGGCNH